MTPNEAEFALSPSCHSVRFAARDAGPLWGGCIPIGYSSVCPSRGGGVLWAGLGQDREQVGLVPTPLGVTNGILASSAGSPARAFRTSMTETLLLRKLLA